MARYALTNALNMGTTARQSRKQTKLLTQIASQAAPAMTPAGWYPCAGDPEGSVRFWDGLHWTSGYKP